MEVNIDNTKILVDPLPGNKVQLRHVTPYGEVMTGGPFIHSPGNRCILKEVAENYIPAFYHNIKQHENKENQQGSPSRY